MESVVEIGRNVIAVLGVELALATYFGLWSVLNHPFVHSVLKFLFQVGLVT
jgi:hypothetical protein